jgi:hypothetical protein
MPLDRFIPASVVVRDYAENLSIVPCMARAGFEWPIPKRDIDAAANRIGDVTVLKPLTEDIAAARGYHPASTDDPGREATMELNATPISDREGAALTACTTEVRKTLRLPSLAEQGAGQDAVVLSNAAFHAAQHDASVKDAAHKWKNCMTVAGVRDLLPESPAEMPSAAIADRLGTILSTVRPEEEKLALTDVRCQTSSGYRQALYDAEWARQSVVPAHDAELFAQVGDAIKSSRATLYDAITAYQTSN